MTETDPLKQRQAGYGVRFVSLYKSLEELNRSFIQDSAPKKEEAAVDTNSRYIVWNPSSPLPPKVINYSRPDAIRAAGAMAHQNPGETFYVCKLVHKASKPVAPAVNYEDLDK